jgi:hypothetical protein
MWQSIKLTIKWIVFGFIAGFFLASAGAGPGGASAIFIALGVAFGACTSVIHNIWLYYKDEHRDKAHLIPSGLILVVFCFSVISDYIVEANCNISEVNYFDRAKVYVQKSGWPLEFLKSEPYVLGDCELGFEYESLEHFNLIIVSPDGDVRLND